jgi:hypothetical protein
MPTLKRGHSFYFVLLAFGRAPENQVKRNVSRFFMPLYERQGGNRKAFNRVG